MNDIDTQSNGTAETQSSRLEEPTEFTAFCPYCPESFTKATTAGAKSAMRMHAMKAHKKIVKTGIAPRKPSQSPGAIAKQTLQSKFSKEDRGRIAREWIASGETAVTYAARLKVNPWVLRDWRDRYLLKGESNKQVRGPYRTRKAQAQAIPAPVSFQKRPYVRKVRPVESAEPAPIRLPNFCPECGFSLHQFIVAFNVAKAK